MNINKLFIILAFPTVVGLSIFVYENPEYLHIAGVVFMAIFWKILRYLQRDSIRLSDFNIHKSSIEDTVLSQSSIDQKSTYKD